MSLLVRPHMVALPFLMPAGVLLTRLVVGARVMVTVVTGVDRVIVHMHTYSDVLVVNTTLHRTDGDEFIPVGGCACFVVSVSVYVFV